MTPPRAFLRPASALSPAYRRAMFRLMDAYYADVSWGAFSRDLAAKDWVLCLETEDGELAGFSTQKVLSHRGLRVVFSGDTVIDRAHRGSQALAWSFGRFMWETLQERPGVPLYWLLITKGVRTYRYLPLYYREFYPRFDRPAPVETDALMRELGSRFFPGRYDPVSGLLPAVAGSQSLRRFDAPERDSAGPHWGYFSARNPGFRRGDELLCLARFEESNLTARVWRRVIEHPPLHEPALV